LALQTTYTNNDYSIQVPVYTDGFDYTETTGHWQTTYSNNDYTAYDYSASGAVSDSYDVPAGSQVEDAPDAAWTNGYTTGQTWVEDGTISGWASGDTPDSSWTSHISDPHVIGYQSQDVPAGSQTGVSPNSAWTNGYTTGQTWVQDGTISGWASGDTPDSSWANYTFDPHVTGYRAQDVPAGSQVGLSPNSAWTSGYTTGQTWVQDGTTSGWASGDTPDSSWTSYTFDPHVTGYRSQDVPAGSQVGNAPNPAWTNGYTSSQNWVEDGTTSGWASGDTPDSSWTNYTFDPHVTGYRTQDVPAGSQVGNAPNPAWTNGYTSSQTWVKDGTISGWASGDTPDSSWTSHTFDPHVTGYQNQDVAAGSQFEIFNDPNWTNGGYLAATTWIYEGTTSGWASGDTPDSSWTTDMADPHVTGYRDQDVPAGSQVEDTPDPAWINGYISSTAWIEDD
jgi:hypothetical protein